MMPRREASSKVSHLFVVNAAMLVKLIFQMVHFRLKSSESDLGLDTGRLLVLWRKSGEGPLEERKQSSAALEPIEGIPVEVDDVSLGTHTTNALELVNVLTKGDDQRGARAGKDRRERSLHAAPADCHQLVKQSVHFTNLLRQNRGRVLVAGEHHR
jgi:hypothetical protein